MYTKVNAFTSQRIFSIRLNRLLIQTHQNRTGNNESDGSAYRKVYIHGFDLGKPINRAMLKKIYSATNCT